MKQTFGLNQMNLETPSWAKWFFRIVFLFNKVVVAYIAATNLIDPAMKYEITLFLTLVIDPFAFGFSKMFGITVEDESNSVIDFQNNEEDIAGGGSKNPDKKP